MGVFFLSALGLSLIIALGWVFSDILGIETGVSTGSSPIFLAILIAVVLLAGSLSIIMFLSLRKQSDNSADPMKIVTDSVGSSSGKSDPLLENIILHEDINSSPGLIASTLYPEITIEDNGESIIISDKDLQQNNNVLIIDDDLVKQKPFFIPGSASNTRKGITAPLQRLWDLAESIGGGIGILVAAATGGASSGFALTFVITYSLGGIALAQMLGIDLLTIILSFILGSFFLIPISTFIAVFGGILGLVLGVLLGLEALILLTATTWLPGKTRIIIIVPLMIISGAVSIHWAWAEIFGEQPDLAFWLTLAGGVTGLVVGIMCSAMVLKGKVK